ncbi:hypothetical protein PARHAE_02319 [Paracoccus haematequi]|uniref:Apea-like HEPN domain-containing protein n=1 Tax=Paracoccus haematequi TaxID=2491866 RepID=A0A3S4DC18_9RHOB|nr:hypothetical protein [Paracoccus haematequi]VDS09130.1 hypothetical protein PARHAE_02319 [Paracoccus haematequi]
MKGDKPEMKIEWKKTPADIPYLLQEISQSRVVNKDGSISTTDFFALSEWESVLLSHIRITEVSDTEAKILIEKAIRDHQTITESSLKEAIFRIKKERDKIPSKKFSVIFPILGLSNICIGRFNRNNVSLNFSPATSSSFYKKAARERAKLLARYPQHQTRFDTLLQKARWCTATIAARSATEAYELTYREIRVILGLIVFMETAPHSRVKSFGHPQPLAKVHIGPQMTVHTANGDLAFEGFWHVKSFSENLAFGRLPRRGEDFKKHLKDWLRKITSSIYPNRKAEDAIIKYYDAFSDHSVDEAFLGGWRVLEHLAGDRDTKYSKLVERASAFYDDPKLAAIYGFHLAERRNSLSHGHVVHQEHSELVIYQMNQFIHPMLKHFIINPYKLKSISEFYEFCDLAWSDERRHRLSRTLSKAMRLRRQ